MSLFAVKVRLATTDTAAVDALGDALAQRGLRIRRKLPALGLVTGTVAADQIEALRALDGVAAVEPESGVRLPPLDPDTPQ